MGNKSSFDPKVHPQIARALYNKGFNDYEVADALEICIASLYAWINKYPELALARREGKANPNARVVEALYKSAVGYDIEEVELRPVNVIPKDMKKDGSPKKNGKTSGRPPKQNMEVAKITKKHIPPNVHAQTFYLVNKLKDDFKSTQSLQIESKNTNTNLNGSIDINAMTREERKKWLEEHGYGNKQKPENPPAPINKKPPQKKGK